MTRLRKIECAGSPREMGRMQGEALKESIQGIIETFLGSDDFRRATGKLLGAQRIFRILGGLSAAAVKISSREAVREWEERVEGIAQGAGIDPTFAKGVQAIETVLAIPIQMSQCTTIGVAPERSGGAGPLVLKNYDIGEILRPTTFLRLSRPAGKLRSIEMFINIMAGNHIAMNEAGLCLSYNYGMVRFYPRPGILPTTMVQFAVENFRTSQQVIDWVSKQRSTNACVITVADGGGGLCVIEKAGSRTSVRQQEGGVTAATNHFLTADMKGFNYDVSVLFGKRSPASLRGLSVQEPNETRLRRARALLEKRSKVSVADLEAIAKDHDGKESGDGNTICRHHEAMMTLASLILVPKEGKVLVCDGSPCEGNYEEIRPFDP